MPLYIEQSGDLDRCYPCLTNSLTHWQTLKDRATKLLIKYKSGALVTQYAKKAAALKIWKKKLICTICAIFHLWWKYKWSWILNLVLFFIFEKKKVTPILSLLLFFSVLEEGLWPKVLAINVSNPFQPLFADEEKIVPDHQIYFSPGLWLCVEFLDEFLKDDL